MNIHRKNQCEYPGFRRGGIRLGTWAMSVPSILHPQGMFDLVPVPVPTPSNPRARSIARTPGFTLIELLVVVAVIVMMMTLAIPAFDAMRGGTDFASEVYDINGALEQARAYAMANNTFVLVGIEEVSASQSSSVSAQASGTGTVAVAVVASKDGTRPYQSMINGGNFGTWSTSYNSGAPFSAVTKLFTFHNIHLVDLQSGAPPVPSSGNMARTAVSPYYDIPNTAECVSATPFAWPLGVALSSSAQYTFNQVIEFDPQGAARIISNTNLDAVPYCIEIGLQPAHGLSATAPLNETSGQMAAIQIDGMSGATRIYRP